MLYRRIKHVNKNKNIHPFGPVWSNDVNESRVFRVSYRRLKGKEEVNHQAHHIIGKWNSLLNKTLGSTADKCSIGAIAKETIEEKLAEEQMLKVKRLINIRFGASTWDTILEERRKRIIEHEKQLEAEQEEKDEVRRKIYNALEWVLGILVLAGSLLALVVYINWVKK